MTGFRRVTRLAVVSPLRTAFDSNWAESGGTPEALDLEDISSEDVRREISEDWLEGFPWAALTGFESGIFVSLAGRRFERIRLLQARLLIYDAFRLDDEAYSNPE